MLELHTWRTPNGKKVPILLAELDRPYTLRLVDLTKNEQKQPEFLQINPNGKIPALVDASGEGAPVVLFESGAILQYLAEKDPERRFLPRGERERAEVLSWLFWQIGGPGPMFGQLGAFSRETPRNEPAYAKFLGEGKRLVSVLEGQLATREWVAGDYSIADIANYPWFAGIATFVPEVLDGATRVRAWMKRAEARPAVQKGMGI